MSDFARSFVTGYMKRWHPGVAYHVSDGGALFAGLIFAVSHIRSRLPLRIDASERTVLCMGRAGWARHTSKQIDMYLEPEPDPNPWQLWSLPL